MYVFRVIKNTKSAQKQHVLAQMAILVVQKISKVIWTLGLTEGFQTSYHMTPLL